MLSAHPLLNTVTPPLSNAKLRHVKLEVTAEQTLATFPPTSAQYVMPLLPHAKKVTNVKAISLAL